MERYVRACYLGVTGEGSGIMGLTETPLLFLCQTFDGLFAGAGVGLCGSYSYGAPHDKACDSEVGPNNKDESSPLTESLFPQGRWRDSSQTSVWLLLSYRSCSVNVDFFLFNFFRIPETK